MYMISFNIKVYWLKFAVVTVLFENSLNEHLSNFPKC